MYKLFAPEFGFVFENVVFAFLLQISVDGAVYCLVAFEQHAVETCAKAARTKTR